MELDSFLASPRWDILQIIAKNPSSPIEIAAKIGTTVSFVSQQLKLLEAAGIVIKKRTGLVERGKPRTLFSLAREIAYIVPLSRDFSQKRTIQLTEEHKVVLKIWELPEQKVQHALEKFFWSIQEYLGDINGMYVYTKDLVPKVFILSNEKALTQKLKGASKKSDKEVDFEVIDTLSKVSTLGSEFLAPIYDPSWFFESEIVLKGGMSKNE